MAKIKRVFILGQAPPKVAANKPFGRTTLYKWLLEAGFTEEIISASFSFGALVKYFPGSKNGSHLKPSPEEIIKDRPSLLADLRHFDPDILVPVGILAIREVFQDSTLKLDSIVGKVSQIKPFGTHSKTIIVIPLPHPSGASPWVHIQNNKKLLTKALIKLKYYYKNAQEKKNK